MAAAATAPGPQIRHYKRHWEDVDNGDYEDDKNPQKRLHHGLPLQFWSSDDHGDQGLGSVEDELVFLVSASPDEKCVESISWLEYLVSATDDQLGIPPGPILPVDGNDSYRFSKNLLSDLFENSSRESDSTPPRSVDLLQRCLSHCYSNNYRDFVEYENLVFSDIDEEAQWLAEALQNWGASSFL